MITLHVVTTCDRTGRVRSEEFADRELAMAAYADRCGDVQRGALLDASFTGKDSRNQPVHYCQRAP